MSDLIRQGVLTAGRQLPPERELAGSFDISRSTVRRALKKLEVNGLLTCRHGSGYWVAQTPDRPVAGSAGRTVAVVSITPNIPESVRLRSAVEGHVQFCVEQELHRAGLHVLNLHPDTLCDDGLEGLRALRPAAVILTTVAVSSYGERLLPLCRACGVPVVTNSHEPLVEDCFRVLHDHAAGSEWLTRQMIAQGRERIVPVFPGTESGWKRARLEGYERAMRDAGLSPIEPIWIPMLDRSLVEHDPSQAERICAGYLHDRVGPRVAAPTDGLLVATDLMASRVASACLSLGLGLDELPAITGYDNAFESIRLPTSLAGWRPLATVDKRNTEIATGLVELSRSAMRQPTSEPVTRVVAPSRIAAEQIAWPGPDTHST
ncbi:MAG: GntR family transcriptional regulator [Planctomycetota bacterium]